MKILLVEDDEATTALLSSALTDDRHTVNIALDGQMGLMLAEAYDYDLVLLDVRVPKLDGISLCRQLRSKGLQMPILLLTAQDSRTDKIMGLDAGADDYVVKPFDLEELRARIRALLRRRNVPLSTVLTWEQLCLDPAAGEVTYRGEPIALTPKELGILELFLRNPQRVFSRSAIIDRLWSLEESPAESAVTTHIKDLRQKLKAGGMAIDLIDTVYGLGYRLKSPSKEERSLPGVGPHRADAAASPDPPQTTRDAIHRVFEKFRNSFMAQLVALQDAAAALQAGELTAALQERARQEAHKLGGSLGIFGYPDGSRLAQAAEALLTNAELPHQIDGTQFSQLVTALQQELANSAASSRSAATPSSVAVMGEHQADETHSLDPFSAPATGFAFNDAAQWLVLFVSQDATLAAQLQAAAPEQLQIRTVACAATTRQTIAQACPDLILLDLSIAGGLLLLAELSRQYSAVPVLVLSERDSLSDRVEVSRLGGKAFLPKPVAIEPVLQAVYQALPRPIAEARVLMVDDDAATLAALKHLLQPWGLQVTTLDHPQHFWETLTTTQPDLVLFDLEMPTFSGIDLCQVVRHDPQWGNLPILVVTSHTDADSIRRVFTAGADDFIAKPIVGPEVVSRILSRLERVRRVAPTVAHDQSNNQPATLHKKIDVSDRTE